MIEPMTLFPLYVSDGLDAQKAYYESNFGFRTVFFDADFYLHLHHEGSGAQLGFMRSEHPTQPSFLHPRVVADGTVITVEVADVDAAFAEAARMGLEIAMDYKVEPWGQRHFMLRDPAGLVVDVVAHEAP